MTDRRPVRNRKSVNYSGIDDCSDDDFADSTPPPLKKQRPTKAPEKSKSKDHNSDDNDEKLPAKQKECGKKVRTALSDKIYERELQKALQLSLSSSQEVAVVHSGSDSVTQMSEFKHKITDTKLPAYSADLHKGEKSSPDVHSPHTESSFTENKCLEVPQTKLIGTVMDESIEILEDSESIETARKKITTTRNTRKKKPLSSDGNKCLEVPQTKLIGTVMDESIEILEDSESIETARKKITTTRNTRKKKPLSSDDESEESSDESEDSYSDADYDDKSDVDFDEKKKSNIKSKAQPSRTKSTKADKTVTKTSPKEKKLSKAANNATSNMSNKTSLSGFDVRPLGETLSHPDASPLESDKRNISQKLNNSIQSVKVTKPAPSLPSSWKPPAMYSPGYSNSLPTVKSPTTGLRLGLSRNQHIKPLHKSFKVT